MKHLKEFRATPETVQEATDLYNKNGIQITRYSAGQGKLGVQVSTGFKKFIQLTEPQMKTLAQILPKIQKDLRKDLKKEDIDHICESKYHVCAVVVEHPEWGVGKPIIGRHAEPDDNGNVEWYDVEFAHGIEEKVYAEGLNILDEMNHGKKKKTEGNAFTMALKAAKEKGDDEFVVAGKKYKVEDYIKKEGVMAKKKKIIDDDASNDQSDDGDGLDKVDPKAAKKKFADRKDKDIDNDGDVDSSDKFLHKRRKAIGKSMKDEPKGEKGETATMNPKKETKESTIRSRLLSIWEDAAGEKRKKDQNRDEQPTERNASAKKMKDGHGETKDMGPEVGEKSVEAGRAVKGKAKARNSGDAVNSGDQNIVNKIKEAYASMYEEKSEELEESILTKNTWAKHSAWKKAHNALQKMEKQFKGTPKEDDYYELLNGLYQAVSDWSDDLATDNPWSTKTATKASYAKGDDPAAMLRKDFKDLLGKDAKKFMA